MLKTYNTIINSRISTIRNILKKNKFDGFIQPRADSYLGEYVPSSSARLEWLCGFSGSAGELLILTNKILLFVDSRYFLQAIKETKNTGIEVILISELTLIEWLNKNIEKTATIGFDPWLYSDNHINNIKNIKLNSCNFKALNPNPIDLLWDNRPKEPSSLIKPHPIKYAGISSKNKINNLIKKMKENKADAYIICQPDSLAWILNIRGKDLTHTPVILARSIVLSNGDIYFFINKKRINTEALKHLKLCGKNIKFLSKEKIFEVIKHLMTKNKKIWIDPSYTPYAIVNNKNINSSLFIKKTCPIEFSKAIKNKTEINGSVKAHKKDGIALCNFLYWLFLPKSNLTEISAAKKIDILRSKQKNFICTSFETISGYGSNGAIVHYRVNNRSSKKFKKNNLYLVDSGGQYLEGTTDVTRTIAIGKPTKDMAKYYTIVLKAHISLANIIFPYGTAGHELDILARKHLWREGLDYGHGTGHGVGSCLSVHEGPQRISRGSKTILEPGMIISNEPGFYLKNNFGIRIENLMIVKKCKKNRFNKKTMLFFKTLTLAPLDIKLINYKMLNKEEINWINNYHSSVYNTISPHLENSNRNWLKNICKKLKI